ncbi:hypothetical protein KIW84_023370 [Lathyrus oleraceus]|uniref:Ubiquitin-like protease family profile domain-containing protein n=1 Tax=Pisum sativum TaxID=3888 RepID=A0A9D4YDZ7_PEA|nr:hypothetical protein KIW84_023370 [Pisum sativum]
MFNLFDDEPTRQGQGVVLVLDSKMKMHSKDAKQRVRFEKDEKASVWPVSFSSQKEGASHLLFQIAFGLARVFVTDFLKRKNAKGFGNASEVFLFGWFSDRRIVELMLCQCRARPGKAKSELVVVDKVLKMQNGRTPTRPTHKAGKGISRRIESVASQKEVPGRKLKKAGKDIPTTSGTKSQIMMRLEKMVEESDIMHGAIRSVDFDEGVFGIAHSKIIAKEDMQQLFEHEELGIAVIHTYIWYMYVTLMRGTELCNRFNFIAASRINTTFITKNPTSVKNELVDRFMAADDNTTPSLYFLPFNSGNGGHWVLVAMDLSRLMVYYLDSLSGDWSKYPSMKKTVDA